MSTQWIPAARFRVLTPVYDRFCRVLGLGEALRRFEVECLGSVRFRRALDVGCGTGETLRAIVNARTGIRAVGVDLDATVLRRTRRKLRAITPDDALVQGRAEELPFPAGSFDLVVSSLMLHHLDSPTKQRALREWRRVLAPGGALLLVDLGVPRKRWLRVLFWPLRFPILEHQADNFRGRVPSMLADAGFTFSEVGVYRSTVVAYLARPDSRTRPKAQSAEMADPRQGAHR